MKQFTTLVAKIGFTMRLEGARGRAMSVKPGDVFLVTNPEHMQESGVKVDRKQRASINSGYMMSHSQIDQLFIKE